MTRTAASFVLFVLSATTAWAQPANGVAAERSLAAPANLPFGAVAGVPAGDPTPGTPTSSVQLLLDATKDQKIGTVAVGWKNGQQNHLQLTFSGPLDDATQQATPISLIGLPSGASVKLGFSRLSWRGPNGREQLEIQNLCKELAARGITPCFTDNEKIPLVERTVLRELNHVDDVPLLIGGELGIDRSSFRFLEPGTLERGTQNHENWSATGKVGYYSPSYGFLFGSYSYRRRFVAGGPAGDICRPIPDTDSTRCESAVIGEPERRTMSVASVELRKFFAAPVAVTPSIHRDFENDVTGVDVPIYFLRSGAPLTGGVRFAWRSDTKEVTAIVFVGSAIGLLPQ